MTWEFQATVSDGIHRLLDRQGAVTWGIEHDGFDVDHPTAMGTAEVGLPTGTTEVLLVPPLPGGLVLDTVRSYQGLTEGELCTLFLGVFDELLTVAAPESRLCLQAIGLAADGRPRIIPGISQPPLSSNRRAVGEMLYHASHGRPWAESLLPVNIALDRCSPALRALVAELLDESVPAGPLTDTIAEVGEALRGLSAPSALPLLPAERDLDPGQALTARLRAANGHSPARIADPAPDLHAAAQRGGSPDGPGEGSVIGTTSPGRRSRVGQAPDSAARLREASRSGGVRTRRGRTETRRARPGRRHFTNMLEWAQAQATGLAGRLTRGRRLPVILAVCLTLIGAAVLVQSLGEDESATPARSSTDADPASGRDADSPTTATTASSGAGDAAVPTDEDIVEVLAELCERRAAALSEGDGDALRELTVPGSTAALADELIDVAAFAGTDYGIELSDVRVVEKTVDAVRASATMTSTAEGGDQTSFEPTAVEFELTLKGSEWKISAVRELADDTER
ncbi:MULTISPECIES: hypothetical protein [unclassified Brevibacterium]|uniref:hypothetical protein n=1 Tax=unclassified Brevibacterium TaxID=2614124 RepID=UPI001E28FD6C|nr:MULTISPECIES: hypothetical protein [unclassified Brevibacterium]MCD1284802.1 hypothetical protein [Brevibacterium sp. CCUG 69071]MDK8435577.1 hypothetical protein [Brevibacterium sp. H-BE7]